MLWLVKIGIGFAEGLKKFKNIRWIVGTFLFLALGSFAAAWFYDPAPGSFGKFLDTVYYTVRLFTISANDRDFLEYYGLVVFAFLDAAFLFITVGVVVAESVARSAVGLTLPKKDHVIVLGSGEWGLHYAKALAKSNRDVVMVDANPSDQAYEEVISRRLDSKLKDEGRLFLIKAHFHGGSDDSLLDKIHASKAKKIITMLDNDEANVDAAYVLKSSMQIKVDSPPTIMLPVDNIRLSASLAVYNRFSEFEEQVEIRSFNIMQQAAVRHFQQHPPELYADIFGQKDIHFAIYGLGDAAINLIYVIGQLCHYRTWGINSDNARHEVKKVWVTVLDQDVEKAQEEIKCLFPNIDQVIDIHFYTCSSSNGIASHDYFLPLNDDREKAIPPVTQHFLCFKDEMLSVRCAVKLRKQQMKHSGVNTPIFVRSQNGKGLARLIESSCGNAEWPDNIFPYVILSDNLDDDIYFSDEIEKIAKTFNDWKVEDNGDELSLEKKDEGEQWGKLSAAFKHSSFFQAAYLRIRLRSVGYDWGESSDETEPVTYDAWVKQDLYQHLALLEHQRYKGERWMMGWNKGERTLGDIARLHPELEGLSSSEEWFDKYDKDQAKMLPDYLKQAGCRLVKRSVYSKKKGLASNDVFIFNLLNHDSRELAANVIKAKKCGEVIGLLPLPFEVIKSLLPLVVYTRKLKCFERMDELWEYLGLVDEEIPNEKGEWIEGTLKSIAKFSGKVDLYIEMPVLHPFDNWLKNDLQVLSWLDEACKQADNYIDCRTGKGGKRSSSFLPKLSSKGVEND